MKKKAGVKMMENNDEKMMELVSYVVSSGYRVRVMNTLSNHRVCIPKQIAKESDILMNHISKVLSELKGKGLIVCLNEDTRKGRLYSLTSLGKAVKVAVDEILV